MKLKLLLFIFVFSGIVNVYGQLSDFTIAVDVTDETCLGNGMLKITASGTTAGATLTYYTYKLPNTSTPISNSTTVSGLSSGNYRVIVTQQLGGESNSKQQDVVVQNKIELLDYVLTSMVTDCAKGSITVNVLNGSGKLYEIIKGPKIVPPQPSNVFDDLVAGQYRIRVFDDCDEALVKDYTLVIGSIALAIGSAVSPDLATSCQNRDYSNSVTASSGSQIAYPLTVKYTVHSPINPTYTIDKTIPSGPVDTLNVTVNLPIYPSQDYTYDISVTDSCGNVFSLSGNKVNSSIMIDISDAYGKCDQKFLIIAVKNLVAPYSINFDSSPSGFDPKTFNSSHPGPFNQTSVTYGNTNLTVPFGVYTVTVTDFCGVKATGVYEVKYVPLMLNSFAYNVGCDATYGTIQISLPERKLVKVVINGAPAAYTDPLPDDVSSYLDPLGVFMMPNLPVGFYDLLVTDDCGYLYNVNQLEVPVFVKQGLVGDSLPDCTFGAGTVSVSSGNGALTSIKITAAPTSFDQNLPYDVTNNLYQGKLFMNNLPEGDYTFEGIDTCGYDLTLDLKAIGYNRTDSGFSIAKNCGSFDVAMAESSNGTLNQAYWLQKLNETTNNWEHPYTGVVYTEGAVPNDSNSISLPNNQTLFNLGAMGKFRILKNFQSYANAASPNIYNDCVEVLGTFEYTDQVKILGVYSLDCEGGGGSNSVVVDVEGVPPFTYKITEKDGDTSFVIDNGNNNVFTNLAVGTYNFQIGDNCGGVKNGKYTVGGVPELVVAYQPADMLVCVVGNDQTETFDLTQQIPEILKTQDPEVYEVSFYKTSPDADNDTNQIVNPKFFPNEINPQTIYARVINTDLDLCYDVTSFQLFVGQSPQLSTPSNVNLCAGESKVISADPGYDLYEWSTGETTSSITVIDGGIYSVTVKNSYGSLTCDASQSITVVESSVANIDQIIVDDWTDSTNSIQIKVSGSGAYEYSLDNMKFQNENVFTNLVPGLYMVYVRDKNGCGVVNQEVAVLNYPRFFSPNGDGQNDKWNIQYSNLEPALKVYVFDRYGKLIAGMDAQSSGWDGTLNGDPMPSTDYWFEVERASGKIYRGHFSLKR